MTKIISTLRTLSVVVSVCLVIVGNMMLSLMSGLVSESILLILAGAILPIISYQKNIFGLQPKVRQPKPEVGLPLQKTSSKFAS